MLAAFGR